MSIEDPYEAELRTVAAREQMRLSREINRLKHDLCFWKDLENCRSPVKTVEKVRYGDPASMFTPAGVDEQSPDRRNYYDTNANALELLKNLGLD